MIGFIPKAYAAGEPPAVVKEIVGKINAYIINPLIILMFAVALIIFLYGVIEFIAIKTDQARKNGKNHMLWGVIGMFIMVSVFTILRIIANTVGSDVQIP
ncbi:hypothetical protein KC842_02280 [Candidatus Nomurabacteria bacterium]|nr:hypothetical protein [Candidatus Nomurabacteria bacterium]